MVKIKNNIGKSIVIAISAASLIFAMGVILFVGISNLTEQKERLKNADLITMECRVIEKYISSKPVVTISLNKNQYLCKILWESEEKEYIEEVLLSKHTYDKLELGDTLTCDIMYDAEGIIYCSPSIESLYD